MLKEYAMKALFSIIKRTNDRSKASLLALLKEIRNKEEIATIDELQCVKYMGPKTFLKLKAELEKHTEIRPYLELVVHNTQESTAIQEIQEIQRDMERLSSNLSELELKYLGSKEKSNAYTTELDNMLKKYRESIQKTAAVEQSLSIKAEHEMKECLSLLSSFDLESINLSLISQESNSINLDVTNNPTSEDIVILEKSMCNTTAPFKDHTADLIVVKSSENSSIRINNQLSFKPVDSQDVKKPEMAVTKRQLINYKPKYNSTSYALMKTLFYHQNGLHKNTLFFYGLEFKPSEMDADKFGVSVRNSLKTLVSKEIVYEENNKYYLSKEGIEIANTLNFTRSTDKTETKEIKLVIDRRERRSQREFTYFQQEFYSIGAETRTLELGDFVWMRGQKVLPFIIERKNTDDFINSVFTGRFKEQCNRMRSLDGFKVFYLLEEDKKIAGKNLNQEVTNLALNNNFTLIRTRSIEETVQFIKYMDRCIKEGKTDQVNSSYHFDESNLIGYGTFTEITSKKCCLSSVELLFSTLIRIRGVTPEKADAIANKYGEMKVLLEDSTQLHAVKYINKQNEEVEIGRTLAMRIIEMLV